MFTIMIPKKLSWNNSFLDGGAIYRLGNYFGPKGVWITGLDSFLFICFIIGIQYPRFSNKYSLSELEKILNEQNKNPKYLIKQLEDLKGVF